MIFKTVFNSVSYINNSTTVTVELIEVVGSIRRVVEKLTFDLDGTLEQGSAPLNTAIYNKLRTAGFDVDAPATSQQSGVPAFQFSV